jgi:Zn-dependent protease/CBS domain-containing protein
MNPTITIGRIAGVKIGLNWSWAIVFALIVWSLQAGVFPDQNPGHSQAAYLGMAFVAAVLFFAALLLHELGHAVQARREGVEIEGITLWLFGGVAQFKGEFPSAGAELRIAIAGPFVTLGIGSVLVAAAVMTHLPDAVDGVVVWLGYINFLLLVFNLVPALPLDGGRVLRAALWGAKGDFNRATRIAADVARAFAFLLIAGGLLLFITEGTFSGAWLAFLGWFLLQAASAEARYPLIREALGGLRVRDLMVPHPITAHPDQTLGEFMDNVAGAARFTAYPVVDGGEVLGVLPFTAVLRTPRSEWDSCRVRDCMLRRDEVPVLGPDEVATEALAALSAGELHRGLVLDDGRLAGLISITDIARVLAMPRRSPRS